MTLRLPPGLARSLERWAGERGLTKSHVVREAVARYLGARTPGTGRELTAAELALRWTTLPRIAPEEAAAFADDLAAARDELPPPAAWD